MSEKKVTAKTTGDQKPQMTSEEKIEAGKAELKNMKTGEKKTLSIGDDFIDAYIESTTAQDDLSF